MTKKIIEDIKINKTLAFVKPSERIVVEKETPKEKIVFKKISQNPHFPKKKKTIRTPISFLFFIVLLTGIVFWSSFIFEKVNIIITKKHQIVDLKQQAFTATKGLKSPIPFEIMIVSDQISEKVNLTKSAEVSLKAKGEVTLYNEYSKTAEKLVAHTYLSDEKGRVYLTDKAVLIPGYTLKDNKVVAGQMSVSVTSFLPGESYNGTPTDFTINSFKNTPKFKKIYGKAGTVFSGGALGLNYSLDDKNKENLKNIANTSFKESLLKKVNSLIPKEYIFYPEASSFSYTINENILSPTAESKVDISGTLSVVLLNENKLKEAIIKSSLPKITEEEMARIQFSEIEKLIFSFNEPAPAIVKDLETVHFILNGRLDFVWNPDIDNLKISLLNAPKENLSAIFEKDVGIGDANIKIFPPWQKTLPLNPNKIKIKVF